MSRWTIVVDVEEEELRQSRDEEDEEDYSVSDAISAEMGWVAQSGIYVESIEEIKEEKDDRVQ